MADVFISYSRRDKAFVQVLYDALRASQYDTWIDWQDIAPTTEWWQEIETGIEAAHTFIFVISPDSVGSTYCRQEVDHAVQHGKRLIPILRRSDFEQSQIPPKLGQHQWLMFQPEDDFDIAFATLVETINTDLEHKKTHTRLQVRAIEWQQQNQDASLLLRGRELEAAEQWLIRASTGKDPAPTELQKDYLASSVAARRSANTRQRATIGVLAALLLGAIGAGSLAWVQYGRTQAALGREGEARELAEQRLNEAEAARQAAEAAQANEAEQRQIAENNEKAAEQSAQAAQDALTQAETARAAEAEQRQVAVGALQRAEAGEAEANRQATVAQEQTQIAQRNEATAREATQRAEQETRRAEGQALNAEIQARSATLQNLMTNALHVPAVRTALELGKKIQTVEANIIPEKDIKNINQNVDTLRSRRAYIEDSVRLQAISALSQAIYFPGYLPYNHLQGHDHWVMNVEWSPDNRALVSTSRDYTIRLWDKQGHVLQVLDTSPAMAYSATFSPDGSIVAAAMSNGKVALWNKNGEKLRSFESESDQVRNVRFSPDGKFLLSSGDDGKLILWNTQGRKQKEWDLRDADHEELSFTHYDAIFSPDGEFIAAIGGNKIQIWALDGSQHQAFRSDSEQFRYIAFSPDSKLIGSGSIGGAVEIWDLDGNEVTTFKADHQGSTFHLSFNPDGKTMMTTGQDGILRIWSLDGQLLQIIRGHSGMVFNATFNADGNIIASSSVDGTIRLWNRKGREPNQIFTHKNKDRFLRTLLFSSSSKEIASISNDRNNREGYFLHVSDANNNQNSRTYDIQSLYCQGKLLCESISSLDISPDFNKVIFLDQDNRVSLLNSESLKIKQIGRLNHRITSLRFGPSSQVFAFAGFDGSIRIWNLSGREILEIDGQKNNFAGNTSVPRMIAFGPDEKRISFIGEGNFVYIYHIFQEELVKVKGSVTNMWAGTWDLVFSPDGQTLLSAHSAGIVNLWDLEGQLLQTFEGHWDTVNSLSFSPDGQVIASASSDGTVRLWDLEGRELQNLEHHLDSVSHVDFSPDGKTLAIASIDGVITLWNLDLDDLMAKSCNWLRDYMANPATPAEDKALCEGYLPTQPLLGRLPWVNNVIGFWQGVLQRSDKSPQT